MKFSIARGILLPALVRAVRVTPTNSPIPLLAHVLLTSDPGGIVLTASDTEITIALALEAYVQEPGACALPAKLLHDYVRRLPEKAEIAITYDGATGHAKLQAGRARTQFLAMGKDGFPALPELVDGATFSIDGGALAHILATSAPAVSSDEARFYLQGHYLHAKYIGERPVLRAVATNGVSMAVAEVEAPKEAIGMPGVIVPGKVAGEIQRLAELHKGELRVSVSEARIEVAAGGAVISSKLIDGNYPDYERVIPASAEQTAIVDAGELAAVIGRVSLFTARGEDRHGTVNFAFSDGRLDLSSKSVESGASEETIEIEYEGEDLSIAFSDRFLNELLQVIKADTLRLGMNGPTSAMSLRARADAPDVFVIMPKRGT